MYLPQVNKGVAGRERWSVAQAMPLAGKARARGIAWRLAPRAAGALAATDAARSCSLPILAERSALRHMFSIWL